MNPHTKRTHALPIGVKDAGVRYGVGVKKLPKSIRKYIRAEKARIRREVLDREEQKRLINDLYQRFLKKKAVKK